MIPLAHDFTGETVLVFGGGSVGARKARRFAREAEVVVVSPGFTDADFGGAQRVRAAPEPGDVPGWFDRTEPALVVAATDDEELNDAVAAAARERGVLRNRADRDARDGGWEAGQVAVPATVRDAPVVVAISTGGASPALARALRERIETDLEGAGAVAEATADLRDRLAAEGVDPSARREAVRAVVRSSRLWTALRAGRSNARQITEDVAADVLEDR